MSDACKDPRYYFVPKTEPETVVCSHCGLSFRKNLVAAVDYYLPPDNGCITEKRNRKQVQFTFMLCPSCGGENIYAARRADFPFTSRVYPRLIKSNLPGYIPLTIQTDFDEACAVVELSPKSAATLCRRCLQGMIHDVWGIHEKNLNAEISSLKAKVSPETWKAIDSLRQIGNIGAHMEHDASLIVDIESSEAALLIQLIEYLMSEWYIRRHEESLLLDSVTSLNQNYQARRNGLSEASADRAPL